MLKHYIMAAIRGGYRNFSFTLISLLGLAVAFSAMVLIGAYVRGELTYEKWIPNYENIYRLAKTASFAPQQTLKGDASGPIEALWLKQDIPEVKAVVRMWPEERGLRNGQIEIISTVVWADPELFEVLALPLHAGNPELALADPDSILLTRDTARSLFGTDNVIGKTVEIDRKFTGRITGVLEDFPGASHLELRVIASSRSSHSPFADPRAPQSIGFGPVYTYLKLSPNSLATVQSSLPSLIDLHVSASDVRGIPPGTKMSTIFTYDLQPIVSIHILPQEDRLVPQATDMFGAPGDLTVVLALTAVAALILLVAAVNFVNFMLARAAQRSVEIGVRKISGASRVNLIVQFMGEATALSIVGAILGIIVGLIFLPAFGAFLNRHLYFFGPADLILPTSILVLAVLVGCLAGVYPALAMSAFHPVTVLRGLPSSVASAGLLRKALVAFQFTVLIVLVVAVTVINRQTKYVLQNNFSLDTDQLLFIDAECKDSLRNRIAALPSVRGVSCAERAILGMDGANPVPATLPDGTSFQFHMVGIDAGALELYGLKPLAGRFLEMEAASATSSSAGGAERVAATRNVSGLSAPPFGVVINESALRGLRYGTPQEAIGKVLPGSVGQGPQIIGVVADFPLRSLRDPIGPLVFRPAYNPTYMIVKLAGQTVGQKLEAIEQVWKDFGNGRPLKSRFYSQFVQSQYEDIARAQQLCTLFSVIAALVAGLGLYGLSALAVRQRAMEIGVRKIYGASREGIVRLLLWQFTLPVLFASLIAWPLSYLLMGRWLQGFAYRIDMVWWMFAAASVLAVLVAAISVLGHAMRLARLQPADAIRHE
jgi:putative ABC transport system permease protein